MHDPHHRLGSDTRRRSKVNAAAGTVPGEMQKDTAVTQANAWKSTALQIDVEAPLKILQGEHQGLPELVFCLPWHCTPNI
jgi:hypothetical protein